MVVLGDLQLEDSKKTLWIIWCRYQHTYYIYMYRYTSEYCAVWNYIYDMWHVCLRIVVWKETHNKTLEEIWRCQRWQGCLVTSRACWSRSLFQKPIEIWPICWKMQVQNKYTNNYKHVFPFICPAQTWFQWKVPSPMFFSSRIRSDSWCSRTPQTTAAVGSATAARRFTWFLQRISH